MNHMEKYLNTRSLSIQTLIDRTRNTQAFMARFMYIPRCSSSDAIRIRQKINLRTAPEEIRPIKILDSCPTTPLDCEEVLML